MARAARVARLLLAPALFAAGVGIAASLFGCAVIAGGSMEPALSPGDVLVYRRAPVRVAAQDVVLLVRPGWDRPVVHRVVAVGPDGLLLTRGDANPIDDREPSSAGDVAGRGLAIAPTGRLLSGLAAWSRRARLHPQPNSSMR